MTEDEELELLRLKAKAKSSASGRNPAVEAVRYGAQGVNRGLTRAYGVVADPINATIDMGTAALNRVAGTDIPQLGKASDNLASLGERAGITYVDRDSVPEQYRPFAAGGETVGESLPFAAAPLAAARAPLQGAFVEGVRAAPGIFAAKEGTAIAGSAVGRGIAEGVAPGNEVAALAGEVLGGLNPATLFISAGDQGVKAARTAKTAFSESGRMDAAARKVRSIIENFGEDPNEVLKALDQAVLGGTAAERSGSVGLAALENSLMRASHMLDTDMKNITEATLANARKALLEGIDAVDGDNATYLGTLAGRLAKYKQALITARIRMAEEALRQSTQRFGGGRSREGFNRAARRVLEDAIADARNVESGLWQGLPRIGDVGVDNTRAALQAVKDDILPSQFKGLVPPEAKKLLRLKEGADGELVADVVEEAVGADSNTLVKLMQQFRKAARDARSGSNPDFNQSRIYNALADGIADDLAELGGEFAEARTFSRNLNDTYTRSVVGDITGQGPRGNQRVRDSETLTKAVPKDSPAGGQVVDELRDATGGTLPGTTSFAAQMEPELESMVIDFATRGIDPQTGRIDANKMASFLQSNEELLSRFPSIKQELEKGVSLERALGARIKSLSKLDPTTRSPYQALANSDRLGVYNTYRDAMKGSQRSPEALGQLFKAAAQADARGVGAGGRDAARSVFFEVLFDDALKGGAFDSRPIREGIARFRDVAERYGIFTQDQLDRIQPLLDEMDKVSTATRNRALLDPEQMTDAPSEIVNTAAQILGANIGGSGAMAQTSGASLVMANKMSRIMRDAVGKLPNQKVANILAEASKNPDLMRELLRRPTSEAAAEKTARRIYSHLLAAGLIHEDEE